VGNSREGLRVELIREGDVQPRLDLVCHGEGCLARAVNLGAEVGVSVECVLGSEVESTGVGLVVPVQLGGDLGLSVDLVVEETLEERQIPDESDEVEVLVDVSDGDGVLGQLALLGVESNFSSSLDSAVLGDGGGNQGGSGEVEVGVEGSVEAIGLVSGLSGGGFLARCRVNDNLEVDLEALSDLVGDDEVGLGDVVRGPLLLQGESVGGRAGRLESSDEGVVLQLKAGAESDSGGGLGVDGQLVASDGETLVEDILGNLSEIRECGWDNHFAKRGSN